MSVNNNNDSLLIIYKMHPFKVDVDCLCIPRTNGGRWLIQLSGWVKCNFHFG